MFRSFPNPHFFFFTICYVAIFSCQYENFSYQEIQISIITFNGFRALHYVVKSWWIELFPIERRWGWLHLLYETKLRIIAYVFVNIDPYFSIFSPFLDKFLNVEILTQKIFRKSVSIYILITVYKNVHFSNKLQLCWQLSSFKIFTGCQTDDTFLNFYFFDC